MFADTYTVRIDKSTLAGYAETYDLDGAASS
jgi:hypothetical protein